MKKIIAIAAASILGGMASPVLASCDAFTTASSVTVAAGSFIKQSFTNKCSANVYLNYDETDTQIGVCAASIKGNFRFTGNSGAGAIVATGTKGTVPTDSNTAANSDGCSSAS